ncbi:MAG: NAD-dependent epimerase/dehydratase family protein [Salinarimonadaceae bacterium]|nr:MAG: NAD-dependent epimerase/dehydratase family protein [Salinarimonadaceae bacterium]
MPDRPLVALTGATGFVGRALARDLALRGFRVRSLLRRPALLGEGVEEVVIGDLARPINLNEAMRGADYVVHSAGIAHAMSGRPEDDYRAVNIEATKALARAAGHAGVKRFLFLSSVRAQSGPDSEEVLDESMPPRPTDAYGRSKLEAEEALAASGLGWAALRPVLVYGPGVKGNLASLFSLARKPVPLPFARFKAPRSLLGLANLADAVELLLRMEKPANRAFLAADPEPIDLAGLVSAYRAGLGRGAWLLPVPQGLITGALSLMGRAEIAERLSRPLVVDTRALREAGWHPRVSTRAGIEALGRHDARKESGRGDRRG